MSQTKATRLNKAAKEFNVSISTIVDYLSSKGHEIEVKPTTKLTPEQYDALLEEFQSEKTMKEQSKKISLESEKRQTITVEDVDKKEEVTEEVEEEDFDISDIKVEPELTAPQSAKEEVEEPKAEETHPEAEVKEESSEPEVPGQPKVVGKIDLSSIDTKTRPTKKSKAKKAAEEKKEQEKPVAKKEEKEVKQPEKPQEPEQKEPEHIETVFEKAEGPKVLGKIDLPVEKKPAKKAKPVASSDNDADTSKKKRKRLKKKVDVRKPIGDKKGGKKGKKGAPKPEVTEEEIQKQIKETLEKLQGGGKSKSSKLRREKRKAIQEKTERELEQQELESKILKVSEFVTASDLANLMNVNVNEIISACFSLGMIVSINQRLDAETISIIAEEFGYEVQFIKADEAEEEILEEPDNPENLVPRPPIVTVMGHVDHGKTSLLDYIRNTNVIAGEAGGITQHIGAYNVEMEDGHTITFLDTPGHEAFTAMRARGAQVTDLAIIVIAADDSVMPQTKEAINHAQAAGVPIIFAFNKIDKPGANADKIREELAQMNILVEDWGGKYQSQEISAKTGKGVKELMEKVVLEAELLELKADPKKRATGTILEASLDKGRGYVANILVQGGTLHQGDIVLAGCHSGKVKAMFNEREQKIKSAGPSIPALLLGLDGAPKAGDKFHVLEDEKEARRIADKRQQLIREQSIKTQKHLTLDEIGRRIALGDFKELNIIIKGDVDGSIEALSDSLLKLSTDKIQVNIIHKAVGQITDSDVMLASASDAIIIGFQVRPSSSARKLAEKEEIDIRLYSIIYDAIEEIKAAMEGMLAPKEVEKVVGTAEVRETFKITKVGTVAGCMVLDGKIKRNNDVRLIREGIVIYTGKLGSLKRFKDDVKEVAAGYECGLNIENFNDIKVGDIVEAFETEEVKQKL